LEVKLNIRIIALFILINLTVSCGGSSESNADVNNQEVNLTLTTPVDTVTQKVTLQPVVVEKIVSNIFSYAAIKSDSSVVTWGKANYGGDSSEVQDILVGVNDIYATDAAFAALKDDGTVVTWGKANYGGDSSNVSSDLYNIKEIISTYSSFAALREDNTVISWGLNSKGYYQTLLTDVRHFVASRSYFSAIKNDGSIVYWNNNNLEDITSYAPSITQLISSNSDVFAAILTSGEVISWGNSKLLENFPKNGLYGVKKVYSTGSGFLAILDDETTKYWGIERNNTLGVNPSATLANVKSVKFSGTSNTIALNATGTVISWGLYHEKDNIYSAKNWEIYNDYPKTLPIIDHIYGFSASSLSPPAFGASDKNGNLYLWGGIGLPKKPINNIELVVGAGGAIAALKRDKTVEYWGNISVEIDPVTLEPKIKPFLTDIVKIYASDVGFAAIKEDGTIITWGKFVNDGIVEF